jgi:hypothetical protein
VVPGPPLVEWHDAGAARRIVVDEFLCELRTGELPGRAGRHRGHRNHPPQSVLTKLLHESGPQ